MKIISLLSTIPGLVFSNPTQPGRSSLSDAFPLFDGTCWKYKGKVKWSVPDSPEIREDTITWMMEIVETIERNGITAARAKGHPADLAWYDENRQPGDYLIAHTGEDRYYMLERLRAEKVLERLLDKNDSLDGLFDESELFLDLPLSINKTFGGLDSGCRWQVIEIDSLDPWLIRELPLPRFTRYSLALVTLPDHTILDFVPGIGIARYRYVHHGTVCEVDVKLVDYRRGCKE